MNCNILWLNGRSVCAGITLGVMLELLPFGVVPAVEPALGTQRPVSAVAPGFWRGTNWSLAAALALKETFDDNVFLQDIGSLAEHHSWVTTLVPSLALNYQPCDAFNASITYAPEINLYHQEWDENYTAHKAGFKFGGKLGSTSWDLVSSIVGVQGCPTGLVFALPGDGPACGGIPIRDRRDQFVNRDLLRVTIPFGSMFVRPVVYYAIHDFKSELQTTPRYQNYVDRWDLNQGLDAGFHLAQSTRFVLGYRYGIQDQSRWFGSPWEYSNTYHRALAGLEGQPFEWLTLNWSMGPDFRTLGSGADPRSPTHFTRLYIEGTASFSLAKADTLSIAVKQFEQPGQGGASLYQDSVTEVTWKHKFSDAWSAIAGFRCTNYKFEVPATRFDWLLSPSLVIAYKINPHWSMEASYSWDLGLSDVPNTPGREYTRNLGAFGVRYSL